MSKKKLINKNKLVRKGFKNWLLKNSLKEKYFVIKDVFVNSSWKKRVIVLVAIIGFIFLVRYLILKSQTNIVTYETSKAEKGTLTTSISGSGTITSVNSTNISTKVSGTVTKVYVTNGDTVKKGQKIAEVNLDDYAKERQTAAWVTYLNAIEAVKTAEKTKVTTDIDMWEDRQDVLDAQEEYNNMKSGGWNPDTNKEYTYNEKAIVEKTLDEAKKTFTDSETKYNNSGADITYANANIAAALRTYQENSSTIVAPAEGIITDLALAEGTLVAASSTTSSTSGATIVSAQTVGKISNPDGQVVATVSLTEVDIINVKANQKVTLTLDAYPDNTFTGKILAVNTSGSISSGVTSYPATILLDPVSVDVYPNMAVSVEIITDIKTDVILILSTAITTVNNQSVVQVVKNKKATTVLVEVGDSNDTSTEITSGIIEGDEVVTATITSESSKTSQTTTSPFSGIGRTSSSSSKSSSSGSMPMGGPQGF